MNKEDEYQKFSQKENPRAVIDLKENFLYGFQKDDFVNLSPVI